MTSSCSLVARTINFKSKYHQSSKRKTCWSVIVCVWIWFRKAAISAHNITMFGRLHNWYHSQEFFVAFSEAKMIFFHFARLLREVWKFFNFNRIDFKSFTNKVPPKRTQLACSTVIVCAWYVVTWQCHVVGARSAFTLTKRTCFWKKCSPCSLSRLLWGCQTAWCSEGDCGNCPVHPWRFSASRCLFPCLLKQQQKDIINSCSFFPIRSTKFFVGWCPSSPANKGLSTYKGGENPNWRNEIFRPNIREF